MKSPTPCLSYALGKEVKEQLTNNKTCRITREGEEKNQRERVKESERENKEASMTFCCHLLDRHLVAVHPFTFPLFPILRQKKTFIFFSSKKAMTEQHFFGKETKGMRKFPRRIRTEV